MIQSSMVGQRVYFASTSTLQFIIKGRLDREGHGQETGGSSWGRDNEGHFFLACFQAYVQLSFLHSSAPPA